MASTTTTCFLLIALCATTTFTVPVPGDLLSEELHTFNFNEQDEEGYQGDVATVQAITQCALTCSVTTTKFTYTPGQTYEYRYEGDVKTSIPGSTQHSSLHMRSTVNIEIISTCEMILRLTDVSLQDSDPSRYESRQHVDNVRPFKQSLESKPLRFAFIDGVVENICPSDGDEIWALNIKRGVLSAFQNTMVSMQGVQTLDETDISGNCPVTYEVLSGFGEVRKVKKTKDLLACKNRVSTDSIVQSVGYDTTSDVQSVPLMRSTLECEQDMSKSNVLTRSECTETHIFRPFSQEKSGATTEIRYKLTFQRKTNGVQSNTITGSSRSSLLYDQTPTATELAQSLRDAQATMSSLCRQTATDVRPDAPAIFSTLVKQMRKLDAKNLRQLLTTVKSACTKAETFYRDALPVLGTSAAVSIIRDLVTKGQVNNVEAERLITSLAFIKNPTTEMIKETKLLLNADLTRSALPVSALVNTYCKQNNAASSAEVAEIIKIFEDALRYNCKTDGDNTQTSKILLALRALGNTGVADRVPVTLNRCAVNEDAPMSVRVAAVNAFRRMPCSNSLRTEMLTLLENRAADTELRINAYIAVMQCVEQITMERVKRLLQTEELNQVGSFIWTHLTNLAETASPMKAEIKLILSDEPLRKEFDIDKRKFSRNIELSAFSELLNIGGTVESNLIWSTGSYVPRSASVNLTVDVFGQSINLFEVGGRAQGLESILERYFGPGKEFENSIKREKRAVIRDDVINTIDRKFPKSRDSTMLSYYIRIFGNEIRARDIYDIDSDSLKNRFNILDLLTKMAEDRSVDFTRNFAFLDSSLVIPTGVGLPLRLAVEGTATVALTANGKIDVRKIMANPSNFDVVGSVRPSAALEIQGEFGVDARVASTRLRITNTLHTSRILDGKLTLKDGQVFNAEWNMPTQKMEIFSAESHFYISYRGEEREQMAPASGGYSRKQCTDPKWARAIGLELCAEVSLPTSQPSVMFPLSGPATARIYLNKLDTYTGARLEASFIRSMTEQTDTARISFDTPGSKVDRQMTADFRLNRVNKDLSFNLRTPWKKVAVTGALVDQAAVKRATLRAVVDDSAEYSVSSEVNIAQLNAVETKYTPNIRVVLPGRDVITLDGEVLYAKNKKMSVKLALKHAFRDPVTIDGSVELQEKKTSKKYDANVQFTSPILRGSLSGFVSKIVETDVSWASRMDLNYIYRGGDKQRIVVNHKLVDSSRPNLKSYSMTGAWSHSSYPMYNGNFVVEEQFSPTTIRVKLDAGFDSTRKITIIQSGAYDFQGPDKKFNGLLKFELPYKRWNYETKFDHVHNSDMLQSNVTIKYDDNIISTVDIGLRKESTKYLNAAGEIKLQLPGKGLMTLTDTITERAPREYYNELNLAGPNRFTAKAVSVYKMGQRHEVTTDITVAGQPPISIKGHFNPNIKNVQARAEATYGPQQYMGDVSWTHRANAQGFNTHAGAELSFPTRTQMHKYGLAVDASRRASDFTGSVEAKSADNRKITLSGSMTANPTSPMGQIRLEWPGSFIAVNSAVKYQAQSWKTTANDLEGSFNVTSSFRGFEEMGGSVRLDVGADTLKSSGSVTWAPNRKITGDVSYDRTKVAVNLMTPFPGYQTIKGEASYVLRGKALTTGTKFSWDSNVLSLNLTGNVALPAFNGKIMLASPFRNFEQLSASASHAIVSGKYQTSGDVTWAAGQQIKLVASMTHQIGSNYALANIGEATVTTPFRGYRSAKLSWNHQNNSTMWKCHHEFEHQTGQDRKYVSKYVFDMDHSIQNTNVRTQKISSKISFTSPIQGWEKLAISWNMTNDQRQIKSQGKGSAIWGTNTINVEHDIFFDPFVQWTAKGKIMTSFRGLEVMAIEADNRWNTRTSVLTAANEITLGNPRAKINLSGNMSLQGQGIDSTLRLTTPYQSLSRVIMNLRSQPAAGNSWETHADFEYAPDKIFSADAKILMDRTYGVELSAKSPYEYMRTATFKTGATVISARKFDTYMEATHNKLRDKIRFDSSVDVESLQSPRISATLTTPFPSLSVLKGSVSHVYQTREKCLSTITYEFNDVKGQLTHEHNKRSWMDFNGKTRLEYVKGKVIQLDTKFTVAEESSLISATLATPFSSASQVTFKLSHNGPYNNFKANAEAVYNRRDKIVVDIDYAVQTTAEMPVPRIKTFKSSLRISTPYDALRKFLISEEFTETMRERTLEYNDKRYFQREDFVMEPEKMRYSSRIETPHESFRTASIEYTMDGTVRSNQMSNRLSVKFNDKEITAGSDINRVGPSIKVFINTPYEVLRSSELNFVHTPKTGRNGNGWSNTYSYELNGARYSGESEYVWLAGGKQQLRAKVTLLTPDEYSVVVNHKVDRGDITTGVMVKVGPFASGSGSFKKDSTSMTVKAAVETPYRGYEKFDVNFKHEGPVSDFKTTASVSTPFKDYRNLAAELTYRGNPSDFKTELKVDTPFAALPKLIVSANHKLTQSELDSGLSVVYDTKKISAGVTYKLEDKTVRVTGDLKTPFKGYESFSAQIQHTGGSTWKDFQTTGRLETSLNSLPSMTFSANLRIPTSSSVTWTGELGLPAGRITTSYSHTGSPTDFRCNAAIATPFKNYETFSFAAEHQGTRDNPRCKLTINTPFRGYEMMSLMTEKSGNWNNLSIKGELLIPNRHALSWTQKIGENLVDIKGKLETPYTSFESQSLSVSHNGPADNFKTTAAIETSINNYNRMGATVTHTVSRRGSTAVIKSTASVETTIRGLDRIGYSVDHQTARKGFKTILGVDTPWRDYNKFGGTVEFNTTEGNDFGASVQITTPIQGYKLFGATINHSGDFLRFDTTGRITTPFSAAQQIDYSINHRGASFSDFASKISADYSGKKLSLEGSFKRATPTRYEENYEGMFKIVSACPYLKDLSLTATHSRKPELKSGSMAVVYNTEKKFDFDYSYTTSGERSININIRDPYPLMTSLNYGDNNEGSAVVSWDTRNKDKEIRFDFGFKNIETATTTDRAIRFITAIPRQRNVGFSVGYVLNPDKFMQKTELFWDVDPQADFTYEVTGSRSLRGPVNVYDGSIKVISDLVKIDSSLSYKMLPHKQLVEVTWNSGEKVTVKSDVIFVNDQDFTHTITVQHPRFTRDVTFVTQSTNGDRFKTILTYERETMTLEGRLTDELNTKSVLIRFTHPTSFTDVQISGDMNTDDEKWMSNLETRYQTTRDRAIQTARLRSEINHIKREVNFELTTPLDTLRFATTNRALAKSEWSVIRYDVAMSSNQFNYKTTFDFSERDKSLDMKLFYNNDDYIQMFAQVLSPTQSSFDLSRVSRGARTNDISASLSLSPERMLTGHAYYRAGLTRDVNQLISSARDISVPAPVQEYLQRARRAINDDFNAKSNSWRQAVAPVQNAAKYVANDVVSKVNEINSALSAAYYRNEFYMKDICQALYRSLETISYHCGKRMAEIRRSMADMSEAVTQRMSELGDVIERSTRDTRLAVQQQARNVQAYFSDVSVGMNKRMAENAAYIRSHPVYKRLVSLQLSDILRAPAQLMERARVMYSQYLKQLQAMLDEAMRRPEYRQLRDSVMKTIQENKWMLSYVGLEDDLDSLLEQARTMNLEQLSNRILQAINSYLKLDQNKWTKWSPEKIEYEFQIYVPMDVPDMSMLRRYDVSKYVADVRSAVARFTPDEDWNLLETIYAYKPSSDPREWVPPFKTHASLTGAQHYMTFDRKFYEFAGECSYLLARDFLDKTFSVVVNYDKVVRGQPTKKSLTVMCEGKQFEVFPDAKITLDGTRVEMPVRVGNTTVSRNGNMISVVNDRGLEVSCDLPHDHCTVSLSGWYYGKTGGLFGTFDNEPSNDLMSIDRSVTDRPEIMADSWTVGTKCRPINRAVLASTPVEEDTRRVRLCASFFKESTSPFRPCFRRVDPEPFQRMCINDIPTDSNRMESEEDICRVAAAYVHECRRHEVHIRMPSKCVRCEVPFITSPFYGNEMKRIEGQDTPRTADVVFVIQHAPCNKGVVEKVKGLIDDMDKALKAEGLQNSRYAVVGFGGVKELSAAHIQTMDGQIFNSADKLPLALNKFELTSGDVKDPMAALRYAVRLSYRAGASKSVVLVSCDSCQEQTVRYSDIQRVLLQSDIRLHVLVQELINLKTKSPKTAYIFGVDEQTVYTRKDVASDDLAGEADLRKYVRLPKDLCVALTQDTDGSIFSVRQWMDSRPMIQKRFTDVMVRTIARKALPAPCQKCECMADEVGAGSAQCQPCESRRAVYTFLPNFYGEDFNEIPEKLKTDIAAKETPVIDDSGVLLTAPPKKPTRRPPPPKPTRRPKPPPANRPTPIRVPGTPRPKIKPQ